MAINQAELQEKDKIWPVDYQNRFLALEETAQFLLLRTLNKHLRLSFMKIILGKNFPIRQAPTGDAKINL